MATKERKVTMDDIKKAFWRYVFFSQCGWNYERMQSVGYCYSMLPIFKKTRPDPEEFKEAFITNLNFFNTNPILGTPLIMGAHIALEEAGASFDTTEGLKVGLMGPLAGVGDTVVWALYNSIIFSICSSMALAGNVLGPILAMILVFFPYMALRWWQITWAYKEGSHLMASIGGGAIGRITEFATIVGLIVIGGFAPSIVHLATPLAYSQNITVGGQTATQTVTVQAQLDAVLPYMLPVLVIFLAYWLLKKKGWNPVQVIMLLVVLGFAGGALGIFG